MANLLKKHLIMYSRSVQLLIVMASTILGLIATDIILPSLPHITHFFMVPPNEGKMLLSIYMMGQFSTVLFWGLIADLLGHKRTLILGMILFFLGAAMSVVAPTLSLLSLSRFLQGAGAVVAPVAGWALIQDLFPKDESAKILAWVGTLTAIVPLFAPVIGGLLDVLYGWQYSFYCIAAYSLTLCIALLSLPKSAPSQPLITLSFKKRISMYLHIVQNKTFISYIALFGLLNCGEWCFLTIAPFYYAEKNIPPNTMGLLLALISLGFVIGSLLASRFFKLFGIDKTLHLGIQLALISSIALLLGELFHWSDYQLFNALDLSCYIASAALLWGGTTSRALQCYETSRGSASAVRSLILLCFSAFGTYFGRLISHVNLIPVSFFLFFTALCALIVFNSKELKTQRLNTKISY